MVHFAPVPAGTFLKTFYLALIKRCKEGIGRYESDFPPRAPSPLRHPHPRAFPPPETSPQFDDHHSVKYRGTLRSSTCRHPFLTLIIRWKRTGAYPAILCSLPWAIEPTRTGYDERGYLSCVLVPLTGKSEKALTSFSISEAMPLEPQRRAPLTRHINTNTRACTVSAALKEFRCPT